VAINAAGFENWRDVLAKNVVGCMRGCGAKKDYETQAPR
jgi:hypothetical protein